MRLFSPIVILVTGAVALLSIALWVMDPASWQQALLSLAFLPVGGAVILAIARSNARRKERSTDSRRSVIRIRAAMVGGAAVLASALGFRLAEALGWETGTIGQSVLGIVLVLVVVCGDLVSARMESKVEDDED